MDENETKSIIDTVERLAEIRVVGTGAATAGDLAIAVVPHGKKLEDLQPYLDKLRDAPRRIVTAAKSTTVQSFIDYLERFKTADTAIFAADDPKAPSLLGVIDYHGQGEAAAPRFGAHRVSYHFPMSDQMKVWSDISGSPLAHEAFASFLAERSFDIDNPPLDWMQVDPATIKLLLELLNIADDLNFDDGAPDEAPEEDGEDRYVPRSALHKLRQIRFGSSNRLLQMARTVEVSVNAKVTEGYNPKTGERTVEFNEEHATHDRGGRKVIVPDAFLIRVPVWEGETPQRIPVRLQYRKKGAALFWFMTLVEWRRVVRYSVRTEAERVAQATGLPVIYGQP